MSIHDSPYHLVDRAESHGGHVLAHVLGHHEHEVYYVLRLARELGPQVRVLWQICPFSST